MRISDWSSDVCSSDLGGKPRRTRDGFDRIAGAKQERRPIAPGAQARSTAQTASPSSSAASVTEADINPQPTRLRMGVSDRQSVVLGKGVSVRVELGCRRIIKKKKRCINKQKRT